MRGRIYSDQKIPDDRRRGLFCPDHPNQMATGRFRVQFGRTTRKRFSVYREAERFLDGLRWEVDQGTYDPRDYRINYTLGFKTLAEKWLKVKEKDVKRRSYTNFELGWRQTIDKDTQRSIIDEVYRISYHLNPKIWLGINWFSGMVSPPAGTLDND